MTQSSPIVYKTNELVHNFLLIGKKLFQHNARKINVTPTNKSFVNPS